jgi:hypothetical protein
MTPSARRVALTGARKKMRIQLWAASAVAVGLCASWTSPSLAQQSQLSEQSVRKYMEYAWSLTPAKFTRPDGRSVEIDKKAPEKSLVPVDTARDVIMAARMTAYAQACEMSEDQVNNYRSLMKREEAKKKWTDQQMIFINQLHLTTVMLLSGKIKLVEEQDGGKNVVIEEKDSGIKKPADDDCKKVREQISAYVAAGPSLASPQAAPGSQAQAAPPATQPPPATTGATPTPGAAKGPAEQKKKQ